MKIKYLFLTLALAGMLALGLAAQQNPPDSNKTAVQVGGALVYLTPISATAAVNTATTLNIPAAAGQYSYICKLAYQVNNDNTATAVTNVVSTSTNFNSFAVKFSAIATASIDSGVLTLLDGSPGTGCTKSTLPGTATTFVSPASVTHSAWTWYATYFYLPY